MGDMTTSLQGQVSRGSAALNLGFAPKDLSDYRANLDLLNAQIGKSTVIPEEGKACRAQDIAAAKASLNAAVFDNQIDSKEHARLLGEAGRIGTKTDDLIAAQRRNLGGDTYNSILCR